MLVTLLLSSLVLGQVAPSLPRPAVNMPFPSSSTQTVNIVSWDGRDMPRVFERSEQPPLNDDDLVKLAGAGFDSKDLIKMIEERRCACDVSADGMVKLAKAGVPKDVIKAMSLHALKPNRALNLLVTLDFTGDSREARQGYLYFFVDDGPITRVFTANLNEILARRNASDVMVDKSDLLITKSVRRLQFATQLELKTYGAHNVLVAASANPTLTHPSQLTENERKSSQLYNFDYPRSSIQSVCRLTAGYKRDAVLTYQWRYMGSRFECEWN